MITLLSLTVRKRGADMRYLTIIGNEERVMNCDKVWHILAFASDESRRKAEEIMLAHRRDDEDLSDTENMFNALDIEGIDYEIFDDFSEVWI